MIRTLLQFVVPKTLPGRLIVVIVSLDTIWTAIAVYGGMARESNPWMAKLVALGPFVYIPVGLLRPIALVRTVEWLRKFNGWGKWVRSLLIEPCGLGLVFIWRYTSWGVSVITSYNIRSNRLLPMEQPFCKSVQIITESSRLQNSLFLID